MKKSKQEIKNRILTFTRQRGPEKSVCPSEVTKDLFSDVWRDHVDDVRTVAGELQSENLIKITQRGKEVRLDEAKGPIRLSVFSKSD
ncbi:DUF3253 domain-containing protein [Gracilimonas tropica]|uniref:DUF3253 domain-containing protein n=1 Tax=Gracilimonas tropica TaxID=454600 RepID=UPI0003822D07|nr:DUF3253 domain-containing protein [Gracilimonas tropica]